MASISKVIVGAAIAAISIASPALAAHKSKPSSAYQNGYVTQSGQRSGVSAFASVPRSADDPAARPYVYVPGEAFQGGGY